MLTIPIVTTSYIVVSMMVLGLSLIFVNEPNGKKESDEK